MSKQGIPRATIFDNGDYSLHVTLQPVCSPIGGQTLIITSQRRESRNPQEEHVRFLANLDADGLSKLMGVIQEGLSKASSQRTPLELKSLSTIS